MRLQIRGHAWLTGFREPGWRAEDITRRVTKLARGHAGVAECSHPESDVDAAFQQINVFIVEHNVDVQLRVSLEKCRESRKKNRNPPRTQTSPSLLDGPRSSLLERMSQISPDAFDKRFDV
jgi:hypothetical protein